jgi:hypothetical protein
MYLNSERPCVIEKACMAALSVVFCVSRLVMALA